MKKIMIAALGVAVTAGMASALPNPPKKAKTFKGEFVAAYDECATTAATDSTNPPLQLPACSNASLTNTGCTFGSAGAGKFSATVSKTDIKVKGTLTKLSCPVGVPVSVHADARVTTNDCVSSSDCTLLDLDDFPTGSTVTVAQGTEAKINVNTTTELAIGLGTQVFKDGKTVEIDLGSVDIQVDNDGSGPNPPLRAFTSGLKVGPQ